MMHIPGTRVSIVSRVLILLCVQGDDEEGSARQFACGRGQSGIKSLVLHNKDGTIFYDSSWIAGVDHTQNEDYDNIYDDSDYESSGSETDVDLEPDYDAEQDYNDEHENSQENSIQEELSYADQSIDDEDIDEEGDGIDQLDLIFQDNNNENEDEEAQNQETEHEAIFEGSLRRSSRQSHVSDRLSRTDGKELQSKALCS
ncbi:hypothetical protein IV203_022215 [Nitzschia inconspicua]|uniref:Uncharacterized protein n=1 Tax=Nitzschia inconspicua TaxID=303405 RepID=A0A9K3KI80_9STRA|nr:hypothetical protein IV203_022215 [Nitzschia inconspicua]